MEEWSGGLSSATGLRLLGRASECAARNNYLTIASTHVLLSVRLIRWYFLGSRSILGNKAGRSCVLVLGGAAALGCEMCLHL
jgi:hypothetical protein